MTKTPFLDRMASASGVVGPLAPSARMRGWIALGVVPGDLVLHGARGEDVAGKLEQVRIADRLRTRETHDRPVLGSPGVHGLDVQATLAVDATDDVRDSHDAGAHLMQEQRHRSADIAEALDDDPGADQLEADVTSSFHDAEHGAATGGLGATLRAAEADGLAGHHAGHRVADVHRVGVHHPGHGLSVRVQVRGRDVLLGTDQDADRGGIATRETLELAHRELLGVDAHTSLAATEGDAHHGALPGHPHGQCANHAGRDVRVVAETALGGTPTQVVLDAVAGEELHAAVIHVHREGHDKFALGLTQDGPQRRVEIEPVGGDVELALGHSPGIDDGGDVDDTHRNTYLPLGERRAGCVGRRAGSHANRSRANVPSDSPGAEEPFGLG